MKKRPAAVTAWTPKTLCYANKASGDILMVKSRYYQDEIHKNVARERFVRSFSQEAAEKLKKAFELSKRKLEKPE